MAISFFVPGLPKPAGSKKAFAHAKTGRIIVTDDSGKPGRDWRACVADNAVIAMAGRDPLAGPVRLVLRFGLPRPKSHFRTGRNAGEVKASAPDYCVTKPDATKLLRAVEDALTGICWRDDAQVVAQEVTKYYWLTPGVDVEIEDMNGDDEGD